MAISIFNPRPGYGIAFPEPGGVPFVMDFENWGGVTARHAIVTGVSLTRQCNVQFLHTLRGFIFLYVLGQKMGDLSITGITFAGECSQQPGPVAIEDGIWGVGDYYEFWNAANTGAPLSVLVGGGSFSAFLIGQKLEILNPKGRLGQFMLQFKLIPPELPGPAA
jgi:hypothetical protein